MERSDGIWLNKFISESGLCSRREADKFIEKGLVLVNKIKAKKGDQVFVGDKVQVNGIMEQSVQDFRREFADVNNLVR